MLSVPSGKNALYVFTGGNQRKTFQSTVNECESDSSFSSSAEDTLPPSSPVASAGLKASELVVVSNNKCELSEKLGSGESSEDRKVNSSLGIDENDLVHVKSKVTVSGHGKAVTFEGSPMPVAFKWAAENDKSDPPPPPVENYCHYGDRSASPLLQRQRSASWPSAATTSPLEQNKSSSCSLPVKIPVAAGDPIPAKGVVMQQAIEKSSPIVNDLHEKVSKPKHTFDAADLVKASGRISRNVVPRLNAYIKRKDRRDEFVTGPVQCTSKVKHDVGSRSTVTHSLLPHGTFREKEFYIGHEEAYIFIHSISDDVRRTNFKTMSRINRGGNSDIYYCKENDVAIKETWYKPVQLNLIMKIQCMEKNVMPLWGVALLDPISSDVCYHIMPKMTYDLHRALKSAEPLLSLAKASVTSEEKWKIIESNAMYIIKCVLTVIGHMESERVKHGDVKEKNILINKRCRCEDILSCTCSEDSEEKFEVFLSDFDYICSTDDHTDISKPGGTLTYRPPEQCEIDDEGHVTEHGQRCSDVWSVGVIIVNLILGYSTSEDRQQANIMQRTPKFDDITPKTEISFIILRRSHVIDKSNNRLANFVDLMKQCLELKASERPTAVQLLTQYW